MSPTVRSGNAAGNRGKDPWPRIETDLKSDLWDVCYFNEEIYLCSMNQLFVLGEDEVAPVALDPVKPETFGKLSSVGHAMLSIGMNDLVLMLPDKAVKVL